MHCLLLERVIDSIEIRRESKRGCWRAFIVGLCSDRLPWSPGSFVYDAHMMHREIEMVNQLQMELI